MLGYISLYVLFHFKHLLADFPLQTDFMRWGKLKEDDWFKPLLFHSLVHSVLTFVLVLSIQIGFHLQPSLAIKAALIDLGSHLVIDLVKCRIENKYELKPKSRAYWHMMGLDQFLHHISSLAIIVLILASSK